MLKPIIQRQLDIYVKENGDKPFIEWLENLTDKSGRYRIKERLDRVSFGNLGDHKSVGKGVYELRCSFGPGYRIYYGLEGCCMILLLCGGDKSTQKGDIKLAQQYWSDYLLR